MQTSLSEIDSLVMFTNNQGRHGRGTLIHISRTSALFEVYNPFSILQLSEVLSDLLIIRGEREIYKGRAIVSNIVTTGIMIIVTVTLTDTWSDLHGLRPGGVLKLETERFINDWTEGHSLNPSYKLTVDSIRNFLGELNRWLDEAEIDAGLRSEGMDSDNLFEAYFEEIKPPVDPKLAELFMQFEHEASRIPEPEVMKHKAFARRALHPLILCSPFAHRAFMKPLGFAGDYEMVNMMLKQSIEKPRSIYARIIDIFHIESSAPSAHRGRIKMIQDRLTEESDRVIVEEERIFSVINIGCGPALEVQNFIADNPHATQTSLQLVDFNEETINYAKIEIENTISKSGYKPVIRFLIKSIDDLLREAHQRNRSNIQLYDMVYCAGLFDYFSDQICKRLVELFYTWLKPGGLVTVTNVDPSNPNRYQMEHLLEWNLIYRDERDMQDLAPKQTQYKISKDDTSVNVFLDIRKPK